MLTFNKRAPANVAADHVVVLPYHQRVKGRLRVTTEDGRDAGIVVERGGELLDGEKLMDDYSCVLEVKASAEPVSVARTQDALLFSRACYHIGNRHAEVQIDAGRLVYLNDSVLDEMLRGLGLEVTQEQLPFSPENGAYARGHAHSHSHGHSHGHDEKHDHSHEHSRAHKHDHTHAQKHDHE